MDRKNYISDKSITPTYDEHCSIVIQYDKVRHETCNHKCPECCRESSVYIEGDDYYGDEEEFPFPDELIDSPAPRKGPIYNPYLKVPIKVKKMRLCDSGSKKWTQPVKRFKNRDRSKLKEE